MFDYETLRLIWWLLLGVLLIGFAVTDGYDLGVGAILRLHRPRRRRAAHGDRGDRAALGRPPGLVRPRRRRRVRRVAAAVCRRVLGLLFRDAAGAARADPAAGRLRLPQQADRRRAGATCGTGRSPSPAWCRRSCSASPSATCSWACRSISPTRCARCTTAASSACSIRSRCCAAWSAWRCWSRMARPSRR